LGFQKLKQRRMLSEDLGHLSPELKERLLERLNSTPVFTVIKHVMETVMTDGAEELKGMGAQRSVFDENVFPTNDTDDESILDLESDALQDVYSYLASRNLTWTLHCLEKETRVPPENGPHDLLQLLKNSETNGILNKQ
jgi:dihydroorotase-like cyclic amidohydrolase